MSIHVLHDEPLPEKLPRWAAFFRNSLTPWAAIRRIAAVTLCVALLGATLMCTFDSEEFPTFGSALWWAAQTVTTVGYGDITPGATSGRIVAVVVMLSGLGFITVSTAAVSATLIEAARRRLAVAEHGGPVASLEEIRAQLERIEAALTHTSQRSHRR
jgi:voltage-gated potassium channel